MNEASSVLMFLYLHGSRFPNTAVGDAELAADAHVLNRYKAAWWLKHLSRVGADLVGYWREQLGEEIEAATRDKNGPPQRKKFA
jgi:hypothetical protein